MNHPKMYEFELVGGEHQEGPDEAGLYTTYKKGDIIISRKDLAKIFRGKFRKVSESALALKDCIVSEDAISPPEDSEIVCEGEKRLSILICTLEKRKKSLNRLLEVLEPQIVDSVEIVIEEDRGEMTTGEKRNILLKRAVGDYIAFIDDDDMISKNYIAKILWALQSSPDCCSLRGLLIRDRDYYEFSHSIRHKRWYRVGDKFLRCPNHLNTVKRELALKVGFPNIYKAEDLDYSERLRPLLKTQAKIKGVLYYYLKVKAWTI